MSYEFFIARRYFRAKQRTGFISLITFISIAGVTIGVMALILVLSTLNGFEDEIRVKLINADGHIRMHKSYSETIDHPDSLMQIIQKIPGVIGSTPIIIEESIIESDKKQNPCLIHGVDLKTIDRVSDLRKNIILGQLDFSYKNINGIEMPGIVVGRYLAEAILSLSIGDVVTLITIPKDGGLFAQPRVANFYIAGIVSFGYYEFDLYRAFISLDIAQQLFQIPRGVSWIQIKCDDYEKAPLVAQQIERLSNNEYTAITWRELNKSLFSAMQIEKWGAFIILCLIIMIAAFNIISSLTMVVMEKIREIGILKSMGATKNSILKIFTFEGIIIGIIGTVLGNILGYSLGYSQIKFKLISLDPDIYVISALPIKMYFIDFIAISGISLLLCFAASLYPAYKAAGLFPVEAIRYE
jgi:lipoprotein-releasing system permease protein